MIDITSEKLISIDEAAKLIPGRDGSSVHPLSVEKWTRPPGKRAVIVDHGAFHAVLGTDQGIHHRDQIFAECGPSERPPSRVAVGSLDTVRRRRPIARASTVLSFSSQSSFHLRSCV
jgi:hypothetical protein